jgi:hypothetical protein
MPLDQEKFLDDLRVRIRAMTPQTRIYRVLRDELTERGYWRRHSRGNPKLGYLRMLETKKKKHE